MTKPPCNTPKKKRFRDRIAASLRASLGERVAGWEQEPYRCPAGHWHLRTVRALGGQS